MHMVEAIKCSSLVRDLQKCYFIHILSVSYDLLNTKHFFIFFHALLMLSTAASGQRILVLRTLSADSRWIEHPPAKGGKYRQDTRVFYIPSETQAFTLSTETSRQDLLVIRPCWLIPGMHGILSIRHGFGRLV